MRGIYNFFTLRREGTNYKVFYFQDERTGLLFEEKLNDSGIWFEKSFDEQRQRTLYGVHPSDMEKCRELNYQSHARFYQGFMSNSPFKWLVITVSVLMVGLAIAGFVMSD